MSSGSFRAIRFGGMRRETFNLKWRMNNGNIVRIQDFACSVKSLLILKV
jgi:hypothetical protein